MIMTSARAHTGALLGLPARADVAAPAASSVSMGKDQAENTQGEERVCSQCLW